MKTKIRRLLFLVMSAFLCFVLLLCHQPHFQIDTEVIDVAEVFKGVIEEVAIQVVEGHEEILVLVSRIMDALIPCAPVFAYHILEILQIVFHVDVP